jgi:plasmid stabilization system protein ParE
MKKILIARSAANDLDGHIRYAEEFSEAAMAKLIRQLDQAMAALSLFPFAGRNLGRRRKFPIPGTTLVLVYRLRDDVIEITRCFDGRTNWTRHSYRSDE